MISRTLTGPSMMVSREIALSVAQRA